MSSASTVDGHLYLEEVSQDCLVFAAEVLFLFEKVLTTVI